MELGAIKDQLEMVMDAMNKQDPTSKEFETLAKRRDELAKVISDEERRRATENLELERITQDSMVKEREIEERKKDRGVKIFGITVMGAVGLAGVYQDKFAVICQKGAELANKISKSFL
jgi:predicted nucleotidyltransferase